MCGAVGGTGDRHYPLVAGLATARAHRRVHGTTHLTPVPTNDVGAPSVVRNGVGAVIVASPAVTSTCRMLTAPTRLASCSIAIEVLAHQLDRLLWLGLLGLLQTLVLVAPRAAFRDELDALRPVACRRMLSSHRFCFDVL